MHIRPSYHFHGSVELVADSNIKSQICRQQELIETLDHLVDYEYYYHSVYGRFTKLLNRTGFILPRSLTENYEVRIVEATEDHLLISAFSEVNGKTLDLVSIDQNYSIHASFEIPPPRSEYLKERAIKHLRLVQLAPAGRLIAEGGVYKDYFKYSVKKDSKGEKLAVAVGVLPPVSGTRLEMDGSGTLLQGSPESLLLTDFLREISDPTLDPLIPSQTSQQFDPSAGNAGKGDEEVFLAQKIFLGEMGRYAKSWAELSRIAHFRFEGKDQYGPVEEIPNLESVQRPGSDRSRINRKVSSHFASGKNLEIEPIKSDE